MMRALHNDERFASHSTDVKHMQDLVDLFFTNVISFQGFLYERHTVNESRFISDLERINSFWKWNLRAPLRVTCFVDSYLNDENATVFQELGPDEIDLLWRKHLALIGEDDGWILENVSKISLTLENLEILKNTYPELRGRYTARKFNLI